jgi:glycosyltransferase involved in cell wall biosynthesis
MKISVVLATHNEAKNIRRCLSAVQSFADEIVVVDGESSDDTPALAREFKAKVISTTNKANFHINKQQAIDAATGDLILQLDADEVVDDELATFIQAQAQTEPTTAAPAAWWLRRKNFFFGHWLRKGGQYPDPVIRLFWAGKAKLPMRDVHEQMVVMGQTATAEGHLLHYSNPTFSEYLRKFNTYTSFKADQLLAQKTQLSLSNHIRYLFWLPFTTFCSLFLRHRGYVDGLAGLLFAVMSGVHHSVSYLKLWEKTTYANHLD